MDTSRVVSAVGLGGVGLRAVGLLGVAVVAGYGSAATAQGGLSLGGARANAGVRAVTPGFAPDPININVIAGGNIDARGLGLGFGCVGFVTRQPDFILRLARPSATLRLYVTSTSDVTLLVRTPGTTDGGTGSWRCNDDSYGGTSPTVDLPNAAAGQYDVWIGAYRAREQARGVLHITELDNHP